MNILKWAFELNLYTKAFIIGVIFIINILFSLITSKYVLNYYDKTQNKEGAMTKFRIIAQYVYIIPLIISVFIISFMTNSFFKAFGEQGKILGVIGTFLILILLLLTAQIIYFKPIKKIRGTTENIGENIRNTLKGLIFVFIPIVIINIAGILSNFKESFKALQPLIIMIVIIAINLVIPKFYKYLLKAEQLADAELKTMITDLLEKIGIKDVEIYQWPSKKNKAANALVAGLIKKRIYISDYLLEEMSRDEIISIIGHEIGHIKKYHLWIRLFIALIPIPVFWIIGEGMEYYERSTMTEIPVIPGILFLVTLFILYIAGFTLWITRIQERDADAYAIKIGINAAVFKSALKKLGELNHMSRRINKLDEKFQTHPAIARRIKWVDEMEE